MKDIKKVLAEEGEAAEQDMDADVTAATKVSRPGRQRSTVFSVRLNDEEMAALQAEAEVQGVRASTLARAMIVRQLPAPDRVIYVSHSEADLASSLGAAQAVIDQVRRTLEQNDSSRVG